MPFMFLLLWPIKQHLKHSTAFLIQRVEGGNLNVIETPRPACIKNSLLKAWTPTASTVNRLLDHVSVNIIKKLLH